VLFIEDYEGKGDDPFATNQFVHRGERKEPSSISVILGGSTRGFSSRTEKRERETRSFILLWTGERGIISSAGGKKKSIKASSQKRGGARSSSSPGGGRKKRGLDLREADCRTGKGKRAERAFIFAGKKQSVSHSEDVPIGRRGKAVAETPNFRRGEKEGEGSRR